VIEEVNGFFITAEKRRGYSFAVAITIAIANSAVD
jgi:hypothetical protein